jgi:hypothetical protein
MPSEMHAAMNMPVVDEQLDVAMRSYAATFGHTVPDEMVERFSRRSWLLTSEIRQAIALHRPVRAWLERSRNGPVSTLHHSVP